MLQSIIIIIDETVQVDLINVVRSGKVLSGKRSVVVEVNRH